MKKLVFIILASWAYVAACFCGGYWIGVAMGRALTE